MQIKLEPTLSHLTQNEDTVEGLRLSGAAHAQQVRILPDWNCETRCRDRDDMCQATDHVRSRDRHVRVREVDPSTAGELLRVCVCCAKKEHRLSGACWNLRDVDATLYNVHATWVLSMKVFDLRNMDRSCLRCFANET